MFGISRRFAAVGILASGLGVVAGLVLLPSFQAAVSSTDTGI